MIIGANLKEQFLTLNVSSWCMDVCVVLTGNRGWKYQIKDIAKGMILFFLFDLFSWFTGVT